MAMHFGLNRSPIQAGATDQYGRDAHGKPRFEVHSVRSAYRVAPDGEIKTDVIIVITQRRNLNAGKAGASELWFRGGCTLVVDPANDAEPIRYAVVKSILSEARADCQRRFLEGETGLSLYSLYFGADSRTEEKEPFALLHVGQ
jgi:hypothetical protein